ncbi:hypothetical protein HMPREF9151_01057 [Hoylesella saccharolytica F0055]|uniref:Uncharacterized protein n=1 Tax=Hoylesella saccharolytica F0055 TaxID=1127699 RepID=L1ND94_9BACT|nr:hypothetical protein HMPREF9151_01057 [Hoylesella saccharolytica F0055]
MADACFHLFDVADASFHPFTFSPFHLSTAGVIATSLSGHCN